MGTPCRINLLKPYLSRKVEGLPPGINTFMVQFLTDQAYRSFERKLSRKRNRLDREIGSSKVEEKEWDYYSWEFRRMEPVWEDLGRVRHIEPSEKTLKEKERNQWHQKIRIDGTLDQSDSFDDGEWNGHEEEGDQDPLDEISVVCDSGKDKEQEGVKESKEVYVGKIKTDGDDYDPFENPPPISQPIILGYTPIVKPSPSTITAPSKPKQEEDQSTAMDVDENENQVRDRDEAAAHSGEGEEITGWGDVASWVQQQSCIPQHFDPYSRRGPRPDSKRLKDEPGPDRGKPLKPVKQRNKTSKRMEKDLLSESDSDVSSSSASSSSSWEERRKTGPFRTRHGVEQRKRYDPVDEMEETSSVGTTKDYVHEKKVKYAYILPEAFIEYADDKLPDYDKMDALFWCTMSYNYKHCSASTDQRRLMKISKRASSDTESSTDEEAEDAEDDDFEAGENVEEEIDVVMK